MCGPLAPNDSFSVRFTLKRYVFFVLLACGLAAMVSAQGMGRGNPNSRQGAPASESVTVSGSLVVAYGFPAIKSGDVTYIVGGIERLAGFIDGLKEGAQVTIEGRAFTSPRDSNLKFLRPAKLTINGKDYDMTPPRFFQNPNSGQNAIPNMPKPDPRYLRPRAPRNPGWQWQRRGHSL